MVEFILRHRVIILVVTVIITVMLGWNMVYLKIDSSFSTVLPKDDPDFLFNRYVEETFGESDEIILLIRSENGVFREAVIRLIDRLEMDLAAIDFIERESIISPASLYSLMFNSTLVPPLNGENSVNIL